MKPLDGIRVIDLSTLFAGPIAAMLLADYGAEVIKVEHPAKPDPARGHGPDGLWWKMLGRGKTAITLNLSLKEGQDLLAELVKDADIVIENFRPGTLERWNLGYDRLAAANPGLVLARVTGFGQFGPYARRPGFGTLAEAMSGFAAMTGQPNGPPTLPPFGLADGITAFATAYAVMTALRARESTGRGQVVDLSIIEPILTVLGGQPIVYDRLGEIPPRLGNRTATTAPRNTYRCSDGTWVAISTSSQNIAERVMRLVGRPELIGEPWFGTSAGRVQHADELDDAVAAWIGTRPRDEVLAAFEQAEAAIAPIYDVRDVMADPQLAALDAITTVDDPELGPVRMQNVVFRMSETPGAIEWTGRPHGADTDRVLASLGLSAEDLAVLRDKGVI